MLSADKIRPLNGVCHRGPPCKRRPSLVRSRRPNLVRSRRPSLVPSPHPHLVPSLRPRLVPSLRLAAAQLSLFFFLALTSSCGFAPDLLTETELANRWAKVRWQAVASVPQIMDNLPEHSFVDLGPMPARFLRRNDRYEAGANARIVDYFELQRLLAGHAGLRDPWLAALHRQANSPFWQAEAPVPRPMPYDKVRYILLVREYARFEPWVTLPAANERGMLELTVEAPVGQVSLVGEVEGDAILIDLDTRRAIARLAYDVREDAAGHLEPVLREVLIGRAHRRLRRMLATILPADALPYADRGT